MRAAALLCCGLLAGCGDVTEIVVRVDSDLAAGRTFTPPSGQPARFAGVRFKVEDLPFAPEQTADPEPVFNEFVPLDVGGTSAAAHLPVELAVVSRGDWGDQPWGIEVRGQPTANASTVDTDVPYIYARALVRFSPGQVLLLPLELYAACAVDAGGTPPCGARQGCTAAGGTVRCVDLTADAPLAPYTPLPAGAP